MSYIPTKVLLHDPDTVANPKALYPVTGLNAIVEGTSGDKVAINITNADNKIKYKYLEVIDEGVTVIDGSTVYNPKVYKTYLPIVFVDGTDKIANSSLDIIGDDGYIKSDLLPSFVDDVIDVRVLVSDPTTGTFYIRKVVDPGDDSVTYRFYTKDTDPESANYGTWQLGGGEAGKIYVAAGDDTIGAGSIFRAVSNDDTTAIKISENPYAIDTTMTNGVALSTDGGNLRAVAQWATNQRWGTIKVDTAENNNAHLNIVDGVLSLTVGHAGGDDIGVVYTVGTDTDAGLKEQAYGTTYVVPTAKYMRDYVNAAITGVDYADSSTAGIVQIGENIKVGDAGLIWVEDAAANVPGVTCIVDTIANTTEGNRENTAKAVTLGGITTYVGGKLTGYQHTMSAGDGLRIDRTYSTVGYDQIDLDFVAPIVYTTDHKFTVRKATQALLGAVIYTGDYSYITNATVQDADGNPIVVNAKAVRDYVTAQLEPLSTIPIPTTTRRGGFRLGTGNDTGLILVASANGNETVTDVLAINAAGAVYVNTNNQLTVYPATLAQSGAVRIVSTGAQLANDAYKTYVPLNSAVKEYVATQLDGADLTFSSGTVEYTYNGSQCVKAVGVDPVYVDNEGIKVSAAGPGQLGVVSTVLTSANMEVVASNGAVPTVGAVKDYVGGVIVAHNFQSALDARAGIYLGNPVIGGVQYNNVISAKIEDPLTFHNSNITLKYKAPLALDGNGSMYVMPATPETSGVVKTLTNNVFSGLAPATSAVVTHPIAVASAIVETNDWLSATAPLSITEGAFTVGYNATTGVYTYTVNKANLAIAIATTEDLGVIRVGSGLLLGNKIIEVDGGTTTKYGYLNLAAATTDALGGVYLATTSAAIVTPAYTPTVPTAAGLVEYVTGVLTTNNYQGALTQGKGIYIGAGPNNLPASNYISARVGGVLDFDNSENIVLKYASPLHKDLLNQLTVSSATKAQAGVVNVVSTIAEMEYEENATYVPYNSAVVSYVSAALDAADLHFESGTTEVIRNGSHYVKAVGIDPIYITGDGIRVRTAALNQLGVVSVVSTIAQMDNVDNATAIPYNSAVVSYVSAKLDAADLNFVSGTSEFTSNGSQYVKAVVDDTTYPWMTLGADGIGVTEATTAQAGVISIVTTSDAVVDTDSAGAVPTNAALIDYVTSEIAAVAGQGELTPGSGIYIGAAPDGTPADNYISAKIGGALGWDPSGNGNIIISQGAQYVTASNTTTGTGGVPIPLAGVRIVSGAGLGVTNGTSAGNLYLKPAANAEIGGVKVPTGSGLYLTTVDGTLKLDSATTTHLGGVQFGADNTGIEVPTPGHATIKVNVPADGPTYIDADTNELTVSGATITQDGTHKAGVVKVYATYADLVAANLPVSAVPNVSGLSSYVDRAIQLASKADDFVVSSGLSFTAATGNTPKTLNVITKSPIQIVDVTNTVNGVTTTSKCVGINIATATTITAAPPNTAVGAVYVRGALRDEAAINADANASYISNTVPTESAVVAAINAIPYITYTALNNN